MTDPGWQRVGPHPGLVDWAAAALPLAIAAIRASPRPWRCGGTWFVGVDMLDHGPDGHFGGVPFPWEALPLDPVPLHRAQLSTVLPGYPKPSPDETETAFRFRLNRDAAHLDGLLPIGPDRRRMICEPHAWILGIPLNTCGAGASPLTVYEGSHLIIGAALRRALTPHPPETWDRIDMTRAYQDARHLVFATCRRVCVPVVPGEASLLHRHLIHGVAPWVPGASVPPEGRIIAYLRPQLPTVAEWI